MPDKETEEDPFAFIKTSGLFPLRSALALRQVSTGVLADFSRFLVGEPKTGAVHRGMSIAGKADRRVIVDVVEALPAGPNPVMVYIHGGGWVAGDLDIYHQLVRRFAEQGFVVVAVEYGLAPENPFPGGYDDCVAAITWTVASISRFGGDPNQIVLAGDSAGGNLAAGIAVSEPYLPIKAVGLFYGVFDLEHMPTTPEIHAEGFLADLHRAYLGAEGLNLLKDPRVAPIYAAERMPPAFIAVGSDDGGLSESDRLAASLTKAGIEHRYIVLPGHPHGFLQLETLPETLPQIKEIATWLKAKVIH